MVADPSSPLVGASVAQGAPNQAETADAVLAPGCAAPWVKGVAQLAPEGDPVLEVPGWE